MAFSVMVCAVQIDEVVQVEFGAKGIICLIGNRQLRWCNSDLEKGTPKEASFTAPIVRKTAELQVALRLKGIRESDSHWYCRIVVIVRHRV